MSTRYSIVYSKRGYPMTTWLDTLEGAKQAAAMLRGAGYGVTVWEYTKDGARMTDI